MYRDKIEVRSRTVTKGLERIMVNRGKSNLWIAIGVLIAYLAIVFSLWAVFDADYEAVSDTHKSIKEVFGTTMAVGIVFLVIVVTALGWWRPTLFEKERVGPVWLWIVPAVLVIGTIINIAQTEWSEVAGKTVPWILIGSIGVGFNEEMTTRGLAIVGARSYFQREVWVMVFSCAVFGAIHIPNIAFGAEVGGTIGQFFFASMVGIVYYVLRRFTGTLIVPMILHGAWDGSVFGLNHSGGEIAAVVNVFYFIAIIASIVGLVMILRERPDADPQLST